MALEITRSIHKGLSIWTAYCHRRRQEVGAIYTSTRRTADDPRWRVYCYTVAILRQGLEQTRLEREFLASEYGTPRKALAAAKKYLNDVA